MRIVRHAILLAAASWLAAACAPAIVAVPAAPSGTPVPLRNAGFEDAPRPREQCAPHWGCTMHADVDSFRFRLDAAAPAAGQRSLCIERVKHEPWALATQGVDAEALRGKRLRFSLSVLAETQEGRGAGPWIRMHGVPAAQGHFERLVERSRGWQRLSVEFTVVPGTTSLEVGAVLEGGGRACIDEARLEVLEPR